MTAPRRPSGPNPTPRAALGRVRPLASDDDVSPGRDAEPATEPAFDLDPLAPAGDEAAGRDLLIPTGRPGGRRGTRGTRPAPMTVPPVTDLMPRPKPAEQKKHGGHRAHAASAKGKARADDSPQVELVVPLSKALRKRLRAKAEEMGTTPELAIAQLVGIWVDG